MNRKPIPLLLLFLTLLPLYSENILGTMSGLLILENGEETSAVELGLEDLASADYLYDNPFVQGVELVFSLPRSTRNFRNSFALYLYKDIQPSPEINMSRYRGSQFFMQILPYTSEFSVKIPFEEGHTLRKEADSVVTAPIGKDYFPVLVTMLPISKGLPAQAKDAVVTMSARPLYSNRGGLKIFIEDEDNLLEEKTIVSIDEEEVEWPRDFYTLEPGFHTVNIENDLGGDREFNIAVEEGKFTEIHHTLETALPRLIFTPREGVEYYLDGELLPPETVAGPVRCEPGTHIIGIKLNEQLILTEEYTLSAGENITISLDTRILFEKD